MRSQDLWKFKFFWDDDENAKNNANILKKHIFFGFLLFFVIFGFFKNFIKTWVKNWVATDAPSLQCLRSKNIINVLHSKLVKKKKMILLSWMTYPFWRKLVSFHGRPTHIPTSLFSRATCPHIHIGLFSGATDPHTHTVYFHGRLALKLTVVYFHGRPEHTWSSWSIFRGDRPTHSH